MRSVRKRDEPNDVIEWKQQASDDWSPTYKNLQHPERSALHESLVAEQEGLCCYCGKSIDSTNSHIEHFRPQATYRDLELDYSNLHASCLKGTKPRTPLHCGHAKGADFDESLAISPLDTDCTERFNYQLNGAISPGTPEDAQARYMIDLLKLDIPFLRSAREDTLSGVFDDAFLVEATEDQLQSIISEYARPDSRGVLPSFGHVVVGFARGLLRRP